MDPAEPEDTMPMSLGNTSGTRRPRLIAPLLSILLLIGTQLQAEDTKIIPVDIYRLVFATDPGLNSRFESHDIERLIARVNSTWSQARVRWTIGQVNTVHVTRDDLPDGLPAKDRREFRRALAKIARRHFLESDDGKRWRIALMQRFPIAASGLYAGEVSTVFYGETSKNGEAQPIVLAHELGHALGLSHVQQETNLMYGGRAKDPGRTRKLERWQIEDAWRQAANGPAPPGGSGNAGRETRRSEEAARRIEIARRLRRFDDDGDGRIAETQVPPRARKAFERVDQGGDGWIDRSEIQRFISGPMDIE